MAAFNNDEKPLDPIAGSREGLVTMMINKFSPNEVSLAEDEVVTALVVIKGADSAVVREGLDLVAVVDVSGSMLGDKLDSVKKALEFVLMKLTPLDRLSVVTFESKAKALTPLRPMTPDAQAEVKGIVGDLKAEGGTDINGGLVTGLDVLRGRVHTESRAPILFLMSDGKNDGPTSGDATTVDPGDVAVYTFGFGKGTDHELLSKVAKNSTGGTYSSVPDGAKLSTSFGMLLGGLVTIVAQDVRLTLTPTMGSLDLKKMTVSGGKDDNDNKYKQSTDAKDVITIKFGNLFAGESRNVCVDFKLKNRENEPQDNFGTTVAKAEHSYAAQEFPQNSIRIRVQRAREPTPADDDSDELTVQAEKLRLQYAEMISEASTMAHDKKLDEALKKVQQAQNKVQDIILDDDGKTVGVLNAELLQLQAYMDTQELYDRLGHPYALATIISHFRQRPAGRGDELTVLSLYLTPRMESYLQQVVKFEENPEEPVTSADEDVNQEILQNPLAAVAAPLTRYLEDAIRALQNIQEILVGATTKRQPPR